MKTTINKILSSYSSNPQDWEISPKGKEEWIRSFFNKLEFKELSITDTLAKLREFYNTPMTERDFSNIFSPFIQKKYKFVDLQSGSKQLKLEEISRIAFELSHALDLEFNSSFLILKRIYLLYPASKWHYETFWTLLGSYDPELKASLFVKVA